MNGYELWATASTPAPGPPDEPGVRTPLEHQLTYIRSVTANEFEEFQQSQSFFSFLTYDSPLRELQDAASEVRDATTQLLMSMRRGSDAASKQVPLLQRRFTDFLSRFRAFDDKTCSWLKNCYGSDSTQLQVFRQALSYEWDNALAYRLSCGLRNVSTHNSSVINDAQLAVELLPDDRRRFMIDLAIDGEKIATAYRAKLNAKVRDELLVLRPHISVHALIRAVMDSCTRAFWSLLESVATEIAEHGEPVKKFHAESNARLPGSEAVFVPAGAYRNPGPDGRIEGFAMNANPMQALTLVHAAVAKLGAFAAVGYGSHDRNDVRPLLADPLVFYEDQHGNLI